MNNAVWLAHDLLIWPVVGKKRSDEWLNAAIKVLSQVRWTWPKAKRLRSHFKSGLKVLSLRWYVQTVQTYPFVPMQFHQLWKWQPFPDFRNNLRILPRIGKHVLLYRRGLREKEEVQEVRVLDKRYDTDVYSPVKSGQIPLSEEVRPTGEIFLISCLHVFVREKQVWAPLAFYNTWSSCDVISFGKYTALFTESTWRQEMLSTNSVSHNNRLNNDHTLNNPSLSLLSASLGYAHCKSDCTCV